MFASYLGSHIIGFLSNKNTEREKQYQIIANNFCSTIIYESPRRVKSFLKELSKYCEDPRVIHICKELTKKYERHWGGNLKGIMLELEKINLRGEFTIIISPKDNNQNDNLIDTKVIEKDLEELVNLGLKRSSAASFLARKNGLPKNIIYNLIN